MRKKKCLILHNLEKSQITETTRSGRLKPLARRPTAASRQHRRDDASVLTRSCLLRSSPPCLLCCSIGPAPVFFSLSLICYFVFQDFKCWKYMTCSRFFLKLVVVNGVCAVPVPVLLPAACCLLSNDKMFCLLAFVFLSFLLNFHYFLLSFFRNILWFVWVLYWLCVWIFILYLFEILIIMLLSILRF